MPARKLSVAEYVRLKIDETGRPQREIAAEVGWPKPNMITMVKKGMTRVPVEKAPALAKALRVDPADFTRRVMQEYMPEAWKAIESTFGESLTENERRLVSLYRDISGEDEVPVDKFGGFLREAFSANG